MPSPYKRLVLCFDGTWNTLKSHTNVSRLYSEIADTSTGCTAQRKFYDEGVGTQWYDRVRGGALGYGLDRNIRAGYAWLASVFESTASDAKVSDDVARVTAPPGVDLALARKPNGDRIDSPPHSSGKEFVVGSDIFLFGFSRGAFTARSLGGLINYLGIPGIDPASLDPAKVGLLDHPRIQAAWDLYAARPTDTKIAAAESAGADAKLVERRHEHNAAVDAFRNDPTTRYPVRVHFIGVWDTVGALGIPRVFDVDWVPRFSNKSQFHDTTLGESIRNAYHAVAIDEERLPYKATLWTGIKPTTEQVEQRWFPGAHADVGGGYEDDLLPASPLEWLANMAAASGLEFVNDRHVPAANHAIPDSMPMAPAAFDLDGSEYLSPVHDSYAEFMGGAYRALRSIPGMGGRVYRRMLVPGDGVNQSVDQTAFLKWKADLDYRPPNLGQAGRTDVTYNVARDDDGATLVFARAPNVAEG
jgi:uncharacterized protein (DUF2235 family)